MPKITPYSPDKVASPLVGVASRNPKGGALREYSRDLRATEEELNKLGNAQEAGTTQIAYGAVKGVEEIANALAYHQRVKNTQNNNLAQVQGVADDSQLDNKLNALAQKTQQENKDDPEKANSDFVERAQQLTDDAKANYPNHSRPNVAGGIQSGNKYFQNPTNILRASTSFDNTLAKHVLSMDNWRFNQGTTNAHLINDTAIAVGQNQIADNPSTDINTLLHGYINTKISVEQQLKSQPMVEHLGQLHVDAKVRDAQYKLSNTTATQMINTLFGKDPIDVLHSAKMLRGGIVLNKGFDGVPGHLDLTSDERNGYESKLRSYENAALTELVTDAKVKEAGATADAGTFKLNAAKNQRNDAVLTNIAQDVQTKIDKTNVEIQRVQDDDTILPKVKQVYINGLVAQRGQYETAYEKTQGYMTANARILKGEAVAERREANKIKADDHRATLGEINAGVNKLAEISTGNLGENADRIQEFALTQVQQINAAQAANKILPGEAQHYIKEYANLIKASATYTKSDPGVLSFFGVKSEVVKQTGEDAGKAQEAALNQFYTSMNKLQGMVSQTQTNITDFNMSPEQNAAYGRNVADAEKVIGGPLNPKQQQAMRDKAIKEVPAAKTPPVQGHKANTASGFVPVPPPSTPIESILNEIPPDVRTMLIQKGWTPPGEKTAKTPKIELKADRAKMAPERAPEIAQVGLKAKQGVLGAQ